MKIVLSILLLSFIIPTNADTATEEQLTRRLFIDLFERLPSFSELKESTEEIKESSYENLVDSMLASKEFNNTLSHKITLHYSPNLSKKRNASGEIDPKYFKRFIRMKNLVSKVYLGKSDFRHFIKDLTAGSGIASAKPALYFYDQKESVIELTGRFSDRVLGVPLKCAQCHNHRDYNDLYQLDFWGLAAFFKNTEVVDLNTHGDVIRIPSRNKFNMRTISALMGREDYRPFRKWYESERKGEFILEGDDLEFKPEELKKRNQKSKLLVNQLLVLENKTNLSFFKITNPDDDSEKFGPLLIGQDKAPYKTVKPRSYLAEWVISDENPFLKKAVTNWVSNWIFGRGFKMPLTDIYGDGLNNQLLEDYSSYFASTKFDIKKLIKKMLISDYYRKQSTRTSDTLAINTFKERSLRQVPAKVILKLADKKEETIKGDFENALTDKAELISYFPVNEDNCDNSYKSSLTQSIFIGFNERLRAVLLNDIPKDANGENLIKESIANFFSRQATAEEVSLMLSLLKDKKGEERVSAINDILWVLINSSEMRLY